MDNTQFYSTVSRLKLKNENFPIYNCLNKVWKEMKCFLDVKQKVEIDIYATRQNIPVKSINKKFFQQKPPPKPKHYNEIHPESMKDNTKQVKSISMPKCLDELYIPKFKPNTADVLRKENRRKENNKLSFQVVNKKFSGSGVSKNISKVKKYGNFIDFFQEIMKKPRKEKGVIFSQVKENEGIRMSFEIFLKNMKKYKTSLKRLSVITSTEKKLVDGISSIYCSNMGTIRNGRDLEINDNIELAFESKFNDKINKNLSPYCFMENLKSIDSKSIEKIDKKVISKTLNIEKGIKFNDQIKNIEKNLIEKLRLINTKYKEFHKENEKELNQINIKSYKKLCKDDNFEKNEEIMFNTPNKFENIRKNNDNNINKTQMFKSKSVDNMEGKKIIFKNKFKFNIK